MSDSEDLREINADDIPGGAESQADKRRRIQRACDACRRKKIKCDGGQTADGICTSCRQLKLSCQYVEVAKKRGPPKGYIESVENRLARMERLLTRLAPGSDFTAELGARIDRVTFDLEAHKAAEPQNALSARSSRQQSPTQAAITAHGGSCSSNHVSQSYAGSPAGSSANCASDQPIKPWEQEDAAAEGDVDEDAEDEIAFIRRIKQLHVETISNEKTPPFMGPSSGIKLLETLQDYRTGMAPGGERGAGVASLFKDLNANRRRIFWDRPSWENVTFECLNHSLKREASSTWPSPALATQLIDNYFNHENIILPLLHRPIFEREFASGLAETDKNFRSLCFTVFAHGSRVSDDPEVFLEDTSPELKVYSRGWPWMNELFKIDKSWDDSSVLHELQCIVLAASFLQGSSHPRACWTMIGLGIRAVFDAGLHRRHIVQAMPPAECELSKRVFWCLYQLDRATASVMGRPVCLHDEDHDIDYPLNVDDEFWEVDEPAQQFKQPDDQPSKIAGFIALLKLSQITGYCIRTVYAINKGRISLNTVEAQQHTVAELDSALNAWLDQLPSHLKWDPHHSHDTWFLQSAMCYSVYYAAQIFVHRPFIPSSTRPSRIGFPSLAICTNAARSGAHIIDVARKRKGFSGIMELPTLGVVFTFGIVLLLNVWGGSKNGGVGDPNRAIKDVSRLLDLLSQTENRFLLAGKLKDILLQLSSQGNMPVQPVQSSSKRTREGVSRDTESASPTSVILDRNIREQPGPLPVDPSTHSNHHSQRKPSGSRSKKNSIGSIARPSHQQQLIDSNRSASMSSSMSSTAPSYDADVPPTPRPAPPSQYATFGAPPLSMSSGGPNRNNGVGGFPTAATFGGAAGMQPFPTDPAGNVTIPAWALASLTSQTGSEESNAFFSSLSMMQGLGTTPGGFNIPNQQQQQQQSSVGGSQPSSDHQQPPSYFNPVHFPVAQHVGPKVSDRIFASNGHGRSADVFVGGPGGDGQTLNDSSLSSYGPDSNSTTTATGNFSTPAPQSGSSSSFSGTQPSPGSQEWDSAALGQLGMDGLQTEEYFPDGFGINDWSAAVFNNGFTQGFATPNDGSGGPLSHNSQNGYSTGGPSSNAQCY